MRDEERAIFVVIKKKKTRKNVLATAARISLATREISCRDRGRVGGRDDETRARSRSDAWHGEWQG